VNRKFSPRREKSRTWIVAVVGGVLAAAVLAVRAVLYSGAHGGDWRAVLAQSGAGGAALGIVVLAVIIPLAWRTYARRRTGHLEMVQAARPDATIIPAFTGRDSLKGLTSTGAVGDSPAAMLGRPGRDGHRAALEPTWNTDRRRNIVGGLRTPLPANRPRDPVRARAPSTRGRPRNSRRLMSSMVKVANLTEL